MQLTQAHLQSQWSKACTGATGVLKHDQRSDFLMDTTEEMPSNVLQPQRLDLLQDSAPSDCADGASRPGSSTSIAAGIKSATSVA